MSGLQSALRTRRCASVIGCANGNGLHLSGIRQRIELIFWTLKDQLGLETHRARTLHGLRAGIASKLLAHSAGIWLN